LPHDPSGPESWLAYGKLLLDGGEPQAARVVLEKGLTLPETGQNPVTVPRDVSRLPVYRPKLQAPRLAQPSMSAIEADVVNRFVVHQRETLARMRSLADRDPASIIIRSPFPPVMYSLLDAFRIVVAHQRRHMAQARRVMASDGFPP
jgi:hypothetical protein